MQIIDSIINLLKKLYKIIIVNLCFAMLLFFQLDTLFALGNIPSSPVPAPSQSFADLVEKVRPAVVSVQVSSDSYDDEDDILSFFDLPNMNDLPDDSPLKRFFRGFNRMQKHKKEGEVHLVAQGSGFFISEDGYVVTNDHVVSDGNFYTVVTDDGKEYKAKLVGRDSRTDVALLKLEDKNIKVPFAKFGDADKMRIGDWVIAVGNPFGLGGTVTAGIISARGRDIGANVYDDFLQIDAAVNKGNSGGPSFNLAGEVVGINTAIFSPSGGSVGIAFAIPSNTAQSVVQQLKIDGEVHRGSLGVKVQTLTKDMAESLGIKGSEGALVAESTQGTAAYKAGLRTGDIILSIEGSKIKTARDVVKKIGATPPNHDVAITAWRNGKNLSFKVHLDQQQDNKKSKIVGSEQNKQSVIVDKLGLKLEVNSKGPGLVISDVAEDSDAEDKGLRAGYVIVAINNIAVKNVSEFKAIIDQACKAKRKSVLLQLNLGGEPRFVVLNLK